MMSKYVLTYFIIVLGIFSLRAQKPTEKMISDMTSKITTLIRANYVLPEKGDLIARKFMGDFKKGRFSKAQTLKKLDSIMTLSLTEASGDYHLFTWNNQKIVQQLNAETQNEENEDLESIGFFNNEEAINANFGFEKVEILKGNIGYIKLSQINISEHSLKKLYAAMNLVDHTQALIIDLRNNSGGGSTVGSVLETFFFEEYKELLEFRERNGKTEIKGTVPWLLKRKYNKPLYVLINKGTASAAEAFAFALRNQDRCILVGEPSSGGAYMNDYFLVNENFIIAISTAAPFLPGTDKSWEGVGVQPDHLIDESDALEKVFELIKSNSATNKK